MPPLRRALMGLGAAAMLGGAPAHAETLSFRGACYEGERVLVAGVGDLLYHEALQRRALAPGGSYARFWAPLAHVIRGADIAYANLEGPAAHGVAAGGYAVKDPGRVLDRRVYGTTPGALVFNYHPSVAADLKAAGFAVVSTANNHAADRGPLGIDRTIDNLEAAGLAFTGTRRRGEARPWSVRTRAKGMTVAWIACSYSTNGMPDPHRQVLDCYDGQETILDEIRRLWDVADVDAVIVTPHWGVEGSHRPLESDRAWARAAIEAGATAIVGTHPHVLQPWERHVAGDGREALIVYSTGNFVSNQPSAAQRTGMIALVSLVRGPTGKAEVAAAGYVLTSLDREAGHRVGEREGDPASRGGQLAQALRILPKGNRVSARAFERLPAACDGPLVAAMPPRAAPPVVVAAALPAPGPQPEALPDWASGVSTDTPDGQANEQEEDAIERSRIALADAPPAPDLRLAVAPDTPDGQAGERPTAMEVPPAAKGALATLSFDGIAWAALAAGSIVPLPVGPAPIRPDDRRGGHGKPALVLASAPRREASSRRARQRVQWTRFPRIVVRLGPTRFRHFIRNGRR